MFKSKVDFNAFDTNNEKVKNIDEPKIKALSKNSVKKLLNSPDTRTPFHLILDYFKDDKGKGLNHFLGFGINKKLDKHFEQVEMKSGKLDKSMSASQKEASMGEAYSKEEGGKKLLCFEPSPKSKIPNGKWPKILKALKPFLAGAKAVVVINGTMVGEDTELPEDSTEDTAATGAEENVGEETTDQAATGGDADGNSLASQFKAQLEEIATSLKQTLPKDIIPKIKARTVEAGDLDVVKEIKEKIGEFEEAYQGAAAAIQEKLTQMRDSIAKQAPKLDQIITAIESLLATTGSDTDSNEENAALKALLELATKGLNEFDGKYDQLKKELENASSEPLATGDELLAQIG